MTQVLLQVCQEGHPSQFLLKQSLQSEMGVPYNRQLPSQTLLSRQPEVVLNIAAEGRDSYQ